MGQGAGGDSGVGPPFPGWSWGFPPRARRLQALNEV